MYDVFNELGLSEEVSRIPEERLMKLYQDHMVHVEQECVSDVKELLLERSDLFAQLDAADVLGRVDQELAVSGGVRCVEVCRGWRCVESGGVRCVESVRCVEMCREWRCEMCGGMWRV